MKERNLVQTAPANLTVALRSVCWRVEGQVNRARTRLFSSD